MNDEDQFLKENVKEFSNSNIIRNVEDEKENKNNNVGNKKFKINTFKLTKWILLLIQIPLVLIGSKLAKLEYINNYNGNITHAPNTIYEDKVNGEGFWQYVKVTWYGNSKPVIEQDNITNVIITGVVFLVLSYALTIAYFYFIHRRSKRSFFNRVLLAYMIIFPSIIPVFGGYLSTGDWRPFYWIVLDIVVGIIANIYYFFEEIVDSIKNISIKK